MQRNWYYSKKAIILFHVLAWLVMFSVPYWFQPPAHRNVDLLRPGHLEMQAISNIFWVPLFYLNAYIFIPLLNRKKTLSFISLHLFCFLIIVFIGDKLSHLFLPGRDPGFSSRAFIFFGFPYLFITAVSTTYRLVLDAMKTRQDL